jgi:hypothetical protein
MLWQLFLGRALRAGNEGVTKLFAYSQAARIADEKTTLWD